MQALQFFGRRSSSFFLSWNLRFHLCAMSRSWYFCYLLWRNSLKWKKIKAFYISILKTVYVSIMYLPYTVQASPAGQTGKIAVIRDYPYRGPLAGCFPSIWNSHNSTFKNFRLWNIELNICSSCFGESILSGSGVAVAQYLLIEPGGAE